MDRGEVEAALAPLTTAFAADGLNLVVSAIGEKRVTLTAAWVGEPCLSCLLPKHSMEALLLQTLQERGLPVVEIDVVMPPV